jgi:hypothetical protein
MIFQTDLEFQNHVRKLINELNFSVSYEDIRKIVEIINYIGTIKIVELYDIFFDFLKPDNFENKQEFSKFLDGIYHELTSFGKKKSKSRDPDKSRELSYLLSL